MEEHARGELQGLKRSRRVQLLQDDAEAKLEAAAPPASHPPPPKMTVQAVMLKEFSAIKKRHTESEWAALPEPAPEI